MKKKLGIRHDIIVAKLLTAAIPKANVLKKAEGLLKAIIDKNRTNPRLCFVM